MVKLPKPGAAHGNTWSRPVRAARAHPRARIYLPAREGALLLFCGLDPSFPRARLPLLPWRNVMGPPTAPLHLDFPILLRFAAWRLG